MRVAIDYGYGYLKAATDNGRQVIAPSVAGEVPESEFDNSSISTPFGNYLFGDVALRESRIASRYQDESWILSNSYKAGILWAISQLTKASRVDIEMTLTLPYQTWKDRVLRDTILLGMERQFTFKNGNNTQRCNIAFPSFFPIVPQNIAPAFAHIINGGGQFIWPGNDVLDSIYIGIVNIGSHTVELGTVEVKRDGQFRGIEAQSTTELAGTFSLSKILKGKLQSICTQKKKWPDHEVFNIIQSGTVQVFNQSFDVKDSINPIIAKYNDHITSLCSQNWSDQTGVPKSSLYGLIISGGGAHIASDKLREFHPNLLCSDNPQWDVVEGCLRLRKMKED